jgi:hypothetical protein
VHLLPRPGFDLEGLVIHDDPAFSAEPMVRADEVSASIRLSSLFRGRIEIANLSATEPSINLVRNAAGRWNLDSLLERTAQNPVAPTAKSPSERRPAFPYLEATHARINFKLGQEKTAFALTDAQVALWQDSENSWGSRLLAQPVRTDFNLTDTGLVHVNATWLRAPSLEQTPMQVVMVWEKGQLGQITKLLTGRDRGWRGSVVLNASLSGTPEAMKVMSQATVDDFRRYDIVGGDGLRLVTSCSGSYNASTGAANEIACQSPVGGGVVALKGNAVLRRDSPYDLSLHLEKVPLASVVRLVLHAKKDLPADLAAEGKFDGEFTVQRDSEGIALASGKGSASEARIFGNGERGRLVLGDIPIVLVGNALSNKRPKAAPIDGEPEETHLRIGPIPLALGGAAPASAAGWLSGAGYRFSLRGDAGIREIYRLADLLALPGARPAAEGSAKLDLALGGEWTGFAAPLVTGSAQLRNLRAEVAGLNTPILIPTASVALSSDTTSFDKFSATTGGTHWGGWVSVPRHCPQVSGCATEFNVTADDLSTQDLADWFKPHDAKRPWYRLLTAESAKGKTPLLLLEAHGSVKLGRFEMKHVTATQVSSRVEFDHGKIKLANLDAQIFEGSQSGDWLIDFSQQPATVIANGLLKDIALAEVSEAFGDAWASGTAEGRFELSGHGTSVADFVVHSNGKLKFRMQNGVFAHVEIPGAPRPFPVHRFSGELTLDKGDWKLSDGMLDSHDGQYQVSGKMSSETGLDVVLRRNDALAWNVSGTLANPQVAEKVSSQVSVGRTQERH